MKRFLALILLFTLCLSLLACTKEAEPTEAPTTTATEAPTKATENKPITPITGDTPLSTGVGCQPSPEDMVE